MFRDLMRDKARTMPADDEALNITALRVWHCNYSSLAPVVQYANLRTLVVATYPDCDLEPVASLAGLEYLSMLHMPRVNDLSPLQRMTRLRTLRLATLPSWDSSGKVTVVDSLRPLAQLPMLAHVELFGVRPATGSLQDLEGAPGLVSVRVSKYAEAETTHFYDVTGVSNDFAPPPGIDGWH